MLESAALSDFWCWKCNNKCHKCHILSSPKFVWNQHSSQSSLKICIIKLHSTVSHPCYVAGIAVKIAFATCFIHRVLQVNQCQDAAMKLQKKCLACTLRILAWQFYSEVSNAFQKCMFFHDFFKTCPLTVHDFFKTCPLTVHDFFKTCLLGAGWCRASANRLFLMLCLGAINAVWCCLMLVNGNVQHHQQESLCLWVYDCLVSLLARNRLAYTDELYQETLVLVVRIRWFFWVLQALVRLIDLIDISELVVVGLTSFCTACTCHVFAES